MKKKRKKKATSPLLPPEYPPHPCSSANLPTFQSLGSAPDAPNRRSIENGDVTALKFVRDLFKKTLSVPVSESFVVRSFLRQITERTVIQWDTVQIGHQLYVHVPLELSKDSFVELLDYAEESMDVDQVIICINRKHPDMSNLIRSFCFMGFQSIDPVKYFNQRQLADLIATTNFHFLGYDLE